MGVCGACEEVLHGVELALLVTVQLCMLRGVHGNCQREGGKVYIDWNEKDHHNGDGGKKYDNYKFK